MTGMKKIPDDVSDIADPVLNESTEMFSPESPEFGAETPMVASKASIWPPGIKLLTVALGVGVIAFSIVPLLVRKRTICDQTETISNARQIGLALYEFESEFGETPNVGTIEEVQRNMPTDLKLGTKFSNDFFRQLIASGIVQSEQMFFAKVSGSHKPDGVIIGADALAKGECGFTYLTGATKLSNPGRPLVVTPMIPGTDRFDPKPFKGKAVVLRKDNSVTSLPIRKDGRVFVDGKNLMDPSHPIWNGKPPVIAWPEM